MGNVRRAKHPYEPPGQCEHHLQVLWGDSSAPPARLLSTKRLTSRITSQAASGLHFQPIGFVPCAALEPLIRIKESASTAFADMLNYNL
jgi:hypothetical protein